MKLQYIDFLISSLFVCWNFPHTRGFWLATFLKNIASAHRRLHALKPRMNQYSGDRSVKCTTVQIKVERINQ